MILLPRFKSRPAYSAHPIVLQIESSHRSDALISIDQCCHPCSVQRFLSPELPTTLRPRRMWQGQQDRMWRQLGRAATAAICPLSHIKWSVSVSGFLGSGSLALHRVGPVYRKIVLSSHSPSKFNGQHDKVISTTFHTTCYSAPVV